MMSGFRAQSAGQSAAMAFVIAAMAPLLAGCDEPKVAAAAAKPADSDVSIVTVKPQPRAMVRELPAIDASKQLAAP